VFLIGVAPALLVFWIRRQVPESDAWRRARTESAAKPGLGDLFRGEVASLTLNTTAVCALSLSGWWLIQFWHPQHLRRLLELSGYAPGAATRSVSEAFFLMNVVAIIGNFAAGWLASRMGNRRAIMLMFAGMAASIVGDAPETSICQKQHLIFESIGAQWPSVTEKHWLPCAPILVINLRAVFRCKRAHAISSISLVTRRPNSLAA